MVLGTTGYLRSGLTYLSDNWLYSEDDALIERDFTRFENDGITLICVLIRWSEFELTEGVYSTTRFANLLNVISKAHDHNIDVLVNIHTVYTGGNVPQFILGADGNGNLKNMFQYYYKYDPVGLDWDEQIDNSAYYSDNRDIFEDFILHLIDQVDAYDNVIGVQFMNETVNLYWTNVAWYAGITAWNAFINDMCTRIRVVSSMPLSIRLACNASYSGYNTTTLGYLDFASFNWYSNWHSLANLQVAIDDAKSEGLQIVLSEFGTDSHYDPDQEDDIDDYLTEFTNRGIEATTAWWWCSLAGPSSWGFNLFWDSAYGGIGDDSAYGDDVPRPAYDKVVAYNTWTRPTDPPPPDVYVSARTILGAWGAQGRKIRI